MIPPDTSRLSEIASRYGICLILQFGSSVRGTDHPLSDVDTAVLLKTPEISLEAHGGLLHELHELFPEQEVDLVLLHRADPLLLKKITENCRLLFGTHPELQRLKLYAFKRYQDHQKYFAMERTYVDRYLQGASPRGD